MTSTTGTDPHPEVAEISALAEGLLPPDRGADVREHIARCALCTDVLHSLEEIRGLLGTLPGPQRMPEDIAGRIDAALAAEALLDATLPRVPRGTSPHVPRETSGPPSGHPGRSTGPGRTDRPGSRPAAARSRRTRGLFAAVSAAAVLILGGVVYTATSGGAGSSAASGSDSDSVRKATGSVDAASVPDRVRHLLAGPTSSDRADTPMLSENTEHTAAAPYAASAVPLCVLKATHRAQAPLATDRELFQGADAYLLVLPHPGDSSRVDAFVVNASCTPSSPGTVLFQGTYSR